MNTYAKIFISLLITIITVACVDAIFGACTDEIFVKQKLTKFQQAMSSDEEFDWLFVGSSRASHHYDMPLIEEKLRIKAFNIGQDGRGLTYHNAVIQTFLRNHKPKTIVLDLLDDDLSGSLNNRIKILYPYIHEYPEIKDLSNFIDNKNQWFLKSSLLRYNSSILELTKCLFHPYSNSFGGYEPLQPIKSDDLQEVNGKANIHIDEIATKSLLDIISLCKNSGIELIVAYSPELIKHNEKLPISTICDSLGVQIIDARRFRLPMSPNEYFNDAVHLNEIGAREYTKYFIEKIHSSDEKY